MEDTINWNMRYCWYNMIYENKIKITISIARIDKIIRRNGFWQ